SVRDIDHRVRAPAREPDAGGDPRHRVGEATSQRRREALPDPQRGERQPRATQPPRDRDAIARPGPATPHWTAHQPERADVHEIAARADQVATEHVSTDTAYGGCDARHDLDGG